ncbi:MAG: hypothetical protein SGI77_22565 [Pirellulaceae bacterium]|nr:hypothetical protein [Pirellulaceae bacterium]
MGKEINVLALVKGDEQYVFFFDDGNRTETLRMLGRYAANPELSFSWYDAAVMSEKIRQALPAKTDSVPSTPSFPARHSVPRFTIPTTGERS